MQCQENNS